VIIEGIFNEIELFLNDEDGGNGDKAETNTAAFLSLLDGNLYRFT